MSTRLAVRNERGPAGVGGGCLMFLPLSEVPLIHLSIALGDGSACRMAVGAAAKMPLTQSNSCELFPVLEL